MKAFRRIAPLAAFASLGLGTFLVTISAGVQAQDDPFEKLKSYDFQSRTPVAAIHSMIQQNISDKAKTAEIEQKLITVLDDPNASFAGKQEACRFLWIIGTPKSVPSLQKMLLDDKLSNMARYALERNQDPSAAKALRGAVSKTSGSVQIGLINSIGNRGDNSAVSLLKPLASSSDTLVSEAAISALGKIGTSSSVSALHSLPPSLIVGKALIRSAEKLAASGKTGEAERIYQGFAEDKNQSLLQAEGLRGLAALHAKSAPETTLASLRSTDPYIQVVSARLAVTMTDPETTDKVIAMWPGVSAPAQDVILAGLAERHEKSAANIAALAAQSHDPILRTTGIQSLAKVGGPNAVPRLVAILIHGEAADKGTAHESLAGMPGADSEAAILKLASSGQPDDRAYLMNVLADRPSAAAKTVLLSSIADSNAYIAVPALKAIGRAGGPAEYPAVIKVLVSTQNDEVRDASKDAVLAISRHIGDRDAAAEPVLSAYAGAASAGKTALLPVLSEIGGDKALDVLTKASSSEDASVKQAAITALAESWSDSKPMPTLLTAAKSDSNKVIRVQALRGYLRLLAQDDHIAANDKAADVSQAIAAAERPEEKKQAVSILRDCRTDQAVSIAAKLLDEPELFSDSADTILYLAAPQRKNDKDQAAVTGAAVTAALDKIIATTKDDAQKALAQKIKS